MNGDRTCFGSEYVLGVIFFISVLLYVYLNNTHNLHKLYTTLLMGNKDAEFMDMTTILNAIYMN